MKNRKHRVEASADGVTGPVLDILYEDDDLVAVDKPAGVYVHASPGHETGTLAEALVRRCPEMARVGSVERPGVVHRLDAGTSGVVVFAKTERAYRAMRALFESHAGIEKTYLAVVHGTPKPGKGTVDRPIGRKPWDPKRMAVDVPDAKRAVTHWEVLARSGSLSLVAFTIETGRTHQIRVHAAALGHPVVGDALYGDAARDRALACRPARPLLHAARLAFEHPFTHRPLVLSAPPPPDLAYAR